MIWYMIWKYGIIIGLIWVVYKIIKEKKLLNNLIRVLVIGLILLFFCWMVNFLIGNNTSIENLKFSKIETIELIAYPDIDKTIYTYIDSNSYHVITKKNNIVEPKTYTNYISSTTSIKMKFIKSNKAYIEVYKPVGFKDENVKWLTTYIPKDYKQYYICIPENTFIIKDGV